MTEKIIDAQLESLTLGEALRLEGDSIELQDGKWQKTLNVINKPEPMNRADAGNYYNRKLFIYFRKQMIQTVKHKKMLDKEVSYLMFNDPNKYIEVLNA